ncbi:MAG: electron transfer flavoprotein subunit alpha/FixB family protein [Dehalococcoidales bacterium]
MSEDILLYGEFQEDKVESITLELLGISRKLADELAKKVEVIFMGHGLAKNIPHEAIAFGADKVYVVDDPLLEDYQSDSYVAVMHRVCKDLTPNIVLFGQTSLGRDLAPRLAFRLEARLVMDCINLSIDPQTKLLVQTKPVYGGNAIASYISEQKPQLATVRAKSMVAAERDSSRGGEIIALEKMLDSVTIRTKVVKRVEEREGTGKQLEVADVVVCGGRGIGSAENFAYLKELARLLNGAVGATRPPCDLEWVSSELQVGLTGKIIAPAIYIGVALSGSSAHLAGFGNAKNIFAINSDPEANIFRVAHYGIVADYKKVMPVIIDTCNKLIS